MLKLDNKYLNGFSRHYARHQCHSNYPAHKPGPAPLILETLAAKQTCGRRLFNQRIRLNQLSAASPLGDAEALFAKPHLGKRVPGINNNACAVLINSQSAPWRTKNRW
jgi:hypothetical protein